MFFSVATILIRMNFQSWSSMSLRFPSWLIWQLLVTGDNSKCVILKKTRDNNCHFPCEQQWSDFMLRMVLQTAGHSERRWLPHWEVGGLPPVFWSSSSYSSLCNISNWSTVKKKCLTVILFCWPAFLWTIVVSV